MKFKTKNGLFVLRALVLVLSFFLTVGNTLKAVNNSQSVVEYIKEARKEASASKKDDSQSVIGAKFCEISQFDEAPGNEDLDNDIDSFLPINGCDFSSILFISLCQYPGTDQKDIVQPPLFILYCQSKAYLG